MQRYVEVLNSTSVFKRRFSVNECLKSDRFFQNITEMSAHRDPEKAAILNFSLGIPKCFMEMNL